MTIRGRRKERAPKRPHLANDPETARAEIEKALKEAEAELVALRALIEQLMRGPRFDHLFIGTSNFNEAWRFWTQVVGFEGKGKWGNPEYAGTIDIGGPTITVAQGEEGPYDELGYTVENGKPIVYMQVKELDEFHAKIVERGAKVVRPPLTTHFGARCFSVQGPDGMVIVFTQSK